MTEQDRAARRLSDRETITAGGILAALVLTAVYATARVGFANPAQPLLLSVGLSLFLVAAPHRAWLALRRDEGGWPRSQPFLALACLALTASVGLVAGPLAIVAGVALALAGGVLALLTLVSWLRRGRLGATLAFVIGASAFAKWTAGVVWTSRYKLPLYWEQFALSANVHHDPLYFASMGNMMRVYGVPSIGLDGVPYAYYHYGSPWLFTQWSHLTGLDLLSFYSLGYAVVLIPFFLVAIGLLVVELRDRSWKAADPPLRWTIWPWIVLPVATIGVVPESALYAMAVWNAHVLISESYLAGLPVFLLVLATGTIVHRDAGGSRAFAFLFIPVAIVALGFLKVSLMLFLLAICAYVVWRERLWKRVDALAAAAIGVAAAYVTFRLVSLPEQNRGFSPLDFMRYSTAGGWQQFFPLVHFAWTWVYLAGRLWEERIQTLAEVRVALRSRRLLDAEVLVLIAVLGFLPGALVSIHGGSAIYFSDVQRWIAIALLMSAVPRWAALRSRRKAERSLDQGLPPVRAIRLSTILTVIVLAPFAFTLVLNAIKPPLRLARQNLLTREALVANARAAGVSVPDGRAGLFHPAALRTGLERGRYFALIEALRDIERLPAVERRRSALFIPQSYELFWRMFDADGRCTFVSLVAPAVAGVALVDGMPPVGCRITEQYNMPAYRARIRAQTAADQTGGALCARARARGAERVILLLPDAQGTPRTRFLECRYFSGP